MSTQKRLQLKGPNPISIPRCLPLPTPLQNSIQGLCDVERLKFLGHGSEGIVYKVLQRKSCSYYALKVVHRKAGSTEKIMREVEIMKKIHSSRIVQFEGAFEEGGNINFLLEYMDGGSLHSLLKLNKRMAVSFLARVARHVLEGLEYLQSENIVHRDIKPSNLLINLNPLQIKIADFGVSTIVSELACDIYNSSAGTCAYMSPERLNPYIYDGAPYDDYYYGGDIWSLGVTLMECYVGHHPFLPPDQNIDLATLMCAICFEDSPTLPPAASTEFYNFIECCLKKDVRRRGTASQLLNHPFIVNNMAKEKFL
ncbi:hypothetical protein SUGI_0261270 [Cryptomeria japonica]|uniref:mitogen-activated protein kinase kinase 7-like n=1 Tax=Cryptomeria japonica TaxID=3369 RepID=UPI002408E9D9|nr:mitogen-activated protein kinase kinase 7-like [Cryptomeria japonica]GLJ15839.1 hypothetical protein SUGI_0261270 [Cryptomeria japonica]